jgi:hypothetical protein
LLIGVIGKKQSGKDTVANHLVTKYGFQKYSLADPMKIACRHIFLMSDEQLWGDQKEVIDMRYNTTPRKILQVMGTELFQYDIYNHIPEMAGGVKPRELWINRFKLWYSKKIDPNVAIKQRLSKHIVISDVRFPHEAKIIKELGGFLIKVFRPGENKKIDGHPSEQEMDDIIFDHLVINDRALRDLHIEVDRVIGVLNGR